MLFFLFLISKIQKEEKLQRARDLKTIQLYRQLLIIELNVDTRFQVHSCITT